MSQWTPWGRVDAALVEPLTGVAAQEASLPHQSGAAVASSIVGVKPPLFCNGPSTGLRLAPKQLVSDS